MTAILKNKGALGRFTIAVLLSAACLLQGCAVFAASQLGYYEASSKYTRLYDTYKARQEEAGAPVRDYKEWLKMQPLTKNEIKVFVMRGVISDEEADEIRQREGFPRRTPQPKGADEQKGI